MLVRPQGMFGQTAAAEGLMAPIGVDEWVARSGERRERSRGVRGARRAWAAASTGGSGSLALAIVALRAAASSASNLQLPGRDFNCALYALLAVGLNIAVGWAGLLDLGYIAFFGFGAYGYALFSSHAFGNLVAGTGGVMLPAIASVPIVVARLRRPRRAGRADRAAPRGRLPRDRHAVRRPGLRRDRQQRRLRAPSAATTASPGWTPFHSFGGTIAGDTGYFYVTLIVLILLMAGLHLLDTRAPAAPGGRCATTRSPRR